LYCWVFLGVARSLSTLFISVGFAVVFSLFFFSLIYWIRLLLLILVVEVDLVWW